MLRILSYCHFERSEKSFLRCIPSTCHFERSEKSSPVYTPHKISPHFVRRNDRPLQTARRYHGTSEALPLRPPYCHFERSEKSFLRYIPSTCHFERSEKSSPVYTPHKISPHFVRRNDRPLQTADDITGQAKSYPYVRHVVISSAARNLLQLYPP